VRVRIALTLTVLLFLAVSPAAAKVYVDFDQDYDFDSVETYSWAETPDDEGIERGSLFESRLREMIESRFQTAGLRPVESDPDVYVTYHTNTKEEMSLDTTTYGYSYGPGMYWDPYWYGYWGGGVGVGGTTTTVRSYTRGTLIIDIWDANENQLVWRGSAEGVLPENPRKLEKQIEKSIYQMGKKFQKQYKKAKKLQGR